MVTDGKYQIWKVWRVEEEEEVMVYFNLNCPCGAVYT
jgi:hypothetical protein